MTIECACGSRNTEELTTHYELVHKGYDQKVEVLRTECHDCGYDFATPSQVNHNTDQIRQAKQIIEGRIVNNQEGE